MRRFAGACRFVFNKALAWQKDRYAADNTTRFSYVALANFLPLWKREKETAWLKDSPSQCLQQTLKDLEKGYKNFFARRARFPRFRKKGQSDRFRYPQGYKLDQANSRIFLPKLGWYDFRRQLDYKLAWNGGQLIAVPPRNTSRTCPRCEHVSNDNRKTQAQFLCVECGLEENADLVGAINVLRAGHARLACADTSPAVEASGQEPTEATQAARAAAAL